MAHKEGPYRHINVQLSEDTREMLNILRRRYGVRSMSEALRRFAETHDSNLVKAAEEIIQKRQSAASE
jgi:hypothetical protein